ncbi:hypothetical protein BDP27DRAFT_1411622 [Rhodocollybia butyracea]|uniref:DUF6535 domain-containing protein n=1 Tax=Rhodocollybia butyracea TaxID=206335 RepID=A0A9P5P2V2_9AGAR|nr:hypothetical protein BDP27DRAFT_1411622 [Rhodocollybia butyracea]
MCKDAKPLVLDPSSGTSTAILQQTPGNARNAFPHAWVMNPDLVQNVPKERSPTRIETTPLASNEKAVVRDTLSCSARTCRKEHQFGLKKEPVHRAPDQSPEAYDYKLKYPEDERYHELDEEARIWWVYLDEATAYDNDMIGELSDSLDILLVFAGLFSAVLSTFVVQTAQSLTQDYTQLSAAYLLELTMLVRVNTNSTALSKIPFTDATFSPSTLDLWVNGLWFTALAIALSIALFAVLARQWLRQYLSIVTGTPRQRAFIRQFRLDGLKKWRVRTIIGMLPVLLHISLMMFLAGLAIFLVSLDIVMAYVVGTIAVTVALLYFAATVLPLVTLQCPYRTTFTNKLYWICQEPQKMYQRVIYPLIMSVHGIWSRLMGQEAQDPLDQKERRPSKVNWSGAERYAACSRPSDDQEPELTALWWLAESTSSPSAKEILLCALGAFTSDMTASLSTSEASRILFGRLSMHLFGHRPEDNILDLEESESIFRAAIHLEVLNKQQVQTLNHFKMLQSSFALKEYPSLKYTASWETIHSALTALASGFLRSVRFFHAGEYTQLSPENAMPWLVEIYQEEGLNLPMLALPPLVWKVLLRSSDQRMDDFFEDVYALSETPYPMSPAIFNRGDRKPVAGRDWGTGAII